MEKPHIVITGVAGNLGTRLLAELADFEVVGIDLNPPASPLPLQFAPMDLGQEKSCRDLFHLLRAVRPVAVIHLAFLVDPVRNGTLDVQRMWQVNVAGTARVMEAIAEANHDHPTVRRFVCPGSSTSYGPLLPAPVDENYPLSAHTFPYAIQKMESDQVVRHRAPAMRGCSTYLLRPAIFAGGTVDNYLLGALHGTAYGDSRRASEMRRKGQRLPCLLPFGDRWLAHELQFVHVDDMARLVAHLLRNPRPDPQRITILNVAGRGETLTVGQCLSTANTRLVRVPGLWALRRTLDFFWKKGISAIPPEATPYLVGQFLVDTTRLQNMLGSDYERVVQHTCAQAFTESLNSIPVAGNPVPDPTVASAL